MYRNYHGALSNFSKWVQKPHAQKYLIYPENIGDNLCIDETSLSKGELYTILSNSDKNCKKGSIVAIVKGTKADVVIDAIKKIKAKLRYSVKNIALDLSPSMAKIARECFPWARQVIDRFHVQKLINEALQDTRVKYRWWAHSIDLGEKDRCKRIGERYKQTIFDNGETVSQLFIRARYALTMHKTQWSKSQIERIQILFDNFPNVEIAYKISQKFREIMNNREDLKRIKESYESYVYNTTKKAEFDGKVPNILTREHYIKAYFKTKLAIWFEYIELNDNDGLFASVKETFRTNHENILNYFINGFSNAKAESLNAKIKDFRRRLRGVKCKTFFLFRLQNLLA